MLWIRCADDSVRKRHRRRSLAIRGWKRSVAPGIPLLRSHHDYETNTQRERQIDGLAAGSWIWSWTSCALLVRLMAYGMKSWKSNTRDTPNWQITSTSLMNQWYDNLTLESWIEIGDISWHFIFQKRSQSADCRRRSINTPTSLQLCNGWPRLKNKLNFLKDDYND